MVFEAQRKEGPPPVQARRQQRGRQVMPACAQNMPGNAQIYQQMKYAARCLTLYFTQPGYADACRPTRCRRMMPNCRRRVQGEPRDATSMPPGWIHTFTAGYGTTPRHTHEGPQGRWRTRRGVPTDIEMSHASAGYSAPSSAKPSCVEREKGEAPATRLLAWEVSLKAFVRVHPPPRAALQRQCAAAPGGSLRETPSAAADGDAAKDASTQHNQNALIIFASAKTRYAAKQASARCAAQQTMAADAHVPTPIEETMARRHASVKSRSADSVGAAYASAASRYVA